MDRWQKCQEKFKKLGILDRVERFSAIKINTENQALKKLAGQIGCTLSHFSILKNCLENQYKNYLILEDDFEIDLDENSFLEKLQACLQDLPNDWDVLYLGGNLTNEYGQFPIAKYSKNLYQVNSCHTTHAIAINHKAASKIANTIGEITDIVKWISNNGTIDVFLSKIFLKKNNCFISNPNLILQQEDFSDIENQIFNYKDWMTQNFNFFANQLELSDLVTVVFTSCGRLDLLKITVESFLKNNTYPIHKYILIENSGNKTIKKDLEKIMDGLNYEIIINEENIGQVASIDKAYSKVDTEYIFHCEDDWEFFDKGFIQKSIDLLKFDKNIVNINLRVRFDGEKGSMHPVSEILKTEKENFYHEYLPNYLGMWHGFSWNPGLRRLSDYLEIKPYKQFINESGVGKKHFSDGKKSACLNNYYCKHIGTNSNTHKSNE